MDTIIDAYVNASEKLKEYEFLPKIHGWLARDKDGELNVFFYEDDKPFREEDTAWRNYTGHFSVLDNRLFPEITWDDNPIEVELLIRKI